MNKCMYGGDFDGVIFTTPSVYNDHRGWFKENWRKDDIFSNIDFVQENVSKSKKGILRGLHIQKPNQGKLVTVLNGSVLDVIVDFRVGSPTFKKAEYFLLTEENGYQLYVPEGFAHGFLTLEDDTIFNYKCTEYYNPTEEYTIDYKDPLVFDMWSSVTHKFGDFSVSDKDRNGMSIDKFVKDVLKV